MDLLRLVGVMAVAVGHVWADDPDMLRAVYTWHVPLFFVLAGFFAGRPRPLREVARAKAAALLAPYLAGLVVVAVPYLAVLVVVGDRSRIGTTVARAVLGGPWLHLPFSAFWFVAALFFAALAHTVVRAWRPGVQVAATAGLYVVSVTVPGLLALVPWSLGLAVPGLVLLQVGALAGWASRQWPRYAVPVGVLLLVAGVLAVAAGVYRPLDIRGGDLGTPWIGLGMAGLWTAAMVVLAARMPTPAAWSRPVSRVMPYVLPVILLHGLGLLIPRASPMTDVQLAVLLVPALLVGPVVFTYAVRRTRLGGWLLGR